MQEININNKEQLCFLGRAILNDLLVKDQQKVKNIIKGINNNSLIILLRSKIKGPNVASDLTEQLKILLTPYIEELIIDVDANKYDIQKTIIINALFEYITEQMVIAPGILSQSANFNGDLNGDLSLFNYYKQTGQLWFINYETSGENYNSSLSLDLEIENLIQQLLSIDKLIYVKEIAYKKEHIPLPSISNITNLINKLKSIIKIEQGVCVYNVIMYMKNTKWLFIKLFQS